MLLKEIMRKTFGVILGVSISAILTYSIINEFYFIPGIAGILTYQGISCAGAFIGGFLSRDIKAGFLTGALAGILGVPLTSLYLSSLMLDFPFMSFLPGLYRTNLGRLILHGLVAGLVGIAGAWIESKYTITKKEP